MRARSYLYVPGDNSRFLSKVEGTCADAIILDLEDSVKIENKTRADQMIGEFLDQTSHPKVMLRIEPSRLNQNRNLINHNNVFRVSLPKVKTPDDVRVFNEFNESKKSIHALIESPIGLENLGSIAIQPNVVSLGIGEVDFFSQLSITQDIHPQLKSFVRNRLVLASSAYGLNPPIAPISTNFKDLDQFRKETLEFFNWGYWGRACIHPAQVEIVNEIFQIDLELRSRAEEIIGALAASKSGAAVNHDGTMIDESHFRWASYILGLDE